LVHISSVATGGTQGARAPLQPQSGKVMGIAEIRGETFCVWGWVGVLLDQLNQSLWWMISAKTRIVSTDVLSLVIYSGAYIYVGLDRFSD